MQNDAIFVKHDMEIFNSCVSHTNNKPATLIINSQHQKYLASTPNHSTRYTLHWIK